MNETGVLKTAREQLGYFRRLSDEIGSRIKSTDDPAELQELKKRAAKLREQEKYWEQQVKQQE